MANDLVRVSHVVVLPNGNIAVGQPQDRALRIFSPAGDDVGTFGGLGSGPAEFIGIAKVGLLSDTLWIWDARQLRVTLMGPHNHHIRTPLLRNEARGTHHGRLLELGFLSPEALYNDGTYLASART